MSSSQKNDLLRDFAEGVYQSEPPSLLGSCLGLSSNFVGSESGQIHSVKLNSCRIWSPIEPHNSIQGRGGVRGRDEPERSLEGQHSTVHKAGSKTPT